MTGKRWMRRLMLLATVSTMACGVIEPCQVEADINMDGTWALKLINGSPIPAHGVVVAGTTNRLIDGSLFFKTYTYSSCDSDVGRVTSGSLVAYYDYVDVVGEPAGRSYTGAKFIYDNGSGDLTITAGAYGANGARFGNEFTIRQDFGGITYSLTFQQVSYQ